MDYHITKEEPAWTHIVGGLMLFALIAAAIWLLL